MDIEEIRACDNKYIWHPFTQHLNSREPLCIKSSEGAYLYDNKGKKIFDAISSWWVNLHGHCHPKIANAISEQAKILEHVIFAEVVHEPAAKLAKNIISVLPKSMSKMFFSDNGSTAVEVALKLAIQYWSNQQIKKNKILALKGSYHGDTFGAMSVAERNAFNQPFWSYLFDVEFLPSPTRGTDSKSYLKYLQETVEKRDDIAAFIYEPLVQGAGGMLMHDCSLLAEVLKYIRQQKILLIADEVMTGFGRTGRWFASDYLETKPDFICLSKGLTGGFLPLSLTVTSKSVFEIFLSNDNSKTFFHGHSYTANPIACAAANASFSLMSEESTWQNINNISRAHESFIAYLYESKYKTYFSDIRQQGTILALEFTSDKKGGYFNSIKEKIKNYFYNKGVFARPLGNVLYMMPPYCVSKKDLQLFYDSVLSFIDEGL
jgi:adenosylmethionine---8-amino-7-oxononanoate aminotransferase